MKLRKKIGLAALFAGLSFTAYGQNQLEKQRILSQTNVQKLQQIAKTNTTLYKKRKAEAIEFAKKNNLEVFKTLEDGRVAELQFIDRFGNPIYYVTMSNLNAAKTTKADRLWTGGSAGLNLNGQGMIVGEWDGGPIRSTHQEFGNRVIQKDGVPFTSANGNNDHATHVAGTMMASGVTSSAIGAAHQSTLWANEWNNDESEATSQAAQGLILSNHSYGYNAQYLSTYQFGYYDDQAATWDEITYNAPYYLPVKAAGNDRGRYNTGKGGYDLVTGFATSKNALVVAAVSAVTNYTSPSSVSMSSFSSWGPTDDGRIKPDISGCGVSVYSTSSSGNTSYNTKSGTSMASPNVTGSLLLVQQHYKNLNNGQFMRSATLRGLAIHTAAEAGNADGPDYRFGWGLLDAENAVNLISNVGTSSLIDERVLNNNGTYSVQVTATGSEPLEVTIAWTDLKGTPVSGSQVDNGAIMLVNDLDVRVAGGGTTNFPWVLNPASPNSAATKGDNFRDNVEKVYIPNPVAGQTYTITVSHKGSLQSGSQAYSLIVSGGTSGGTTPVCAVPGGLNSSNVTNTSATVSWSSVSGATSYDLRYRATGSASWTNVNGLTSTSRNLSSLTLGTEYEFQVLTNCADGSSVYSTSATFTTTGGIIIPTYCESKGNNSSYEWIAGVQIGSLNRTSGNDGGYSDQTSTTVNLAQGSTNAVTLTPGFSGSSYNEYWKVWIDFNKDGDFEDSGELVFDAGSMSSSAVSGTLDISPSAATGTTRMRVSMKYNGAQNSCETFTYGEVEDYSVNITESSTPSCGVPTGLATSNVTTSTFTASWSAVAGASSYDVQVRTSGGAWSPFNATSTSLNLTGASPSTTYEVQVRANCSGASSAYSASVFVTTSAPPVLNYCDSKGNSVADEWIQRVRVGSIDNNSGSNGGYADFTNLSTTLTKGTSYTITIDPAWSGRTYSEAYNVWIDYNQDGDFNDAGEEVYSRARTTSTSVSGSFTIPTSAANGTTRMRVTMKYNANATSCETFSYGEVEDYTIVINTSTQANLHPVASSPVYATFDDAVESPDFAFVAYPNPASSSLNIKLGYFGVESELVVYSITGAEMIRTSLSEQNTTLDISKLAKGMYILSVNSGRKVETIKFIKE
ncbi:GEVED domain-containing protein [Bernardetia sp.]|uniref:GEVED domain-containing protein n=1 Tax=Bernardetia sp. TaxID=1937974 RepID=UPI0025BD36BF|nr:GEVED domain-containing protein [Bernardetia sp.]